MKEVRTEQVRAGTSVGRDTQQPGVVLEGASPVQRNEHIAEADSRSFLRLRQRASYARDVQEEVAIVPSPHAATSLTLDHKNVRQLLLFGASVAIARILTGIILGHAAYTVFSSNGDRISHPKMGTVAHSVDSWATFLNRWDAFSYLSIARRGYFSKQYCAYFPGYSALIWLIHAVTGHLFSFASIALAISWISFIGATALFALFVGRLCNNKVATLAVVLFAWSPASIFLLAPYPMSLVVLLILATLLLLQSQKYAYAAVVSGLAAAVHPLGACLIVAVLVATYDRQKLHRTALYGALAGWGLWSFMIYLWVAFSNPFQFISSQRWWHTVSVVPFSGPFLVLRQFFEQPQEVLQSRLPKGTLQVAIDRWDVYIVNDAMGFVGLAVFVYFVAAALGRTKRVYPLYFSVFSATSLLVLNSSIERLWPYNSSYNPEALTRHTLCIVGVIVAIAVLLERRPRLAAVAMPVWMSLGIFLQTVFVLGYYYT